MSAMDSSHTGSPPKYEKEDDESSIDLALFGIDDNKSSSVNLKMLDTEDFKSSDTDDCCHHIEQVSTIIQMFSIFITSIIITN
jgi:hypothetical protein